MLKAALLIALLGLASLIIILKTSSLSESTLSQAKALEEGSAVRVTGVVEKVMVREGLTRITLKKEETIEVVLFQAINVSAGSRIEAQGKVQDYEGEKELMADKISII